MENLYDHGYICINHPFDQTQPATFAAVKLVEDLGERKKVEYLDIHKNKVNKLVMSKFVLNQQQMKQYTDQYNDFLNRHSGAQTMVKKLNAKMQAHGIAGKCTALNGDIKLKLDYQNASLLEKLLD